MQVIFGVDEAPWSEYLQGPDASSVSYWETKVCRHCCDWEHPVGCWAWDNKVRAENSYFMARMWPGLCQVSLCGVCLSVVSEILWEGAAAWLGHARHTLDQCEVMVPGTPVQEYGHMDSTGKLRGLVWPRTHLMLFYRQDWFTQLNITAPNTW